MAVRTRQRLTAETVSNVLSDNPRLTLWGTLFVAGVIFGVILVNGLFPAQAPRVSDAEYVLIVADLFDRERSVLNARDRLEAIGLLRSDDAIAAATDTLRKSGTARQRDVDVVEQLGRALRDPAAVDAPGNSEATSTASDSNPDSTGISTLARLLIIILALTAIAGLLWRTGAFPMTTIMSSVGRVVGGLRDRSAAFGPTARHAGGRRSVADEPDDEEFDDHETDEVDRTRYAPAPTVSPRTTHQFPVARERDDLARSHRGHAPLDVPTAVPGAKSGLAPRSPSPERHEFESSFVLGEDSGDDLHPIIEKRSGTLIGAFGLSPARRQSGAAPYAFAMWLHDYTGRGELKAVGIVTKNALSRHQAAVDSWQQRGEMSDVYILERGLLARLQTPNIRISVTLRDLEFAPGAEGHEGGVLRVALAVEAVVNADLTVHAN